LLCKRKNSLVIRPADANSQQGIHFEDLASSGWPIWQSVSCLFPENSGNKSGRARHFPFTSQIELVKFAHQK